jgi:hypothetical protein
MVFFEQAQIVIRRVKNQFAAVEHVEQRIKIDFRERVNEFVAVGGADLDEADFFWIGVKAVGLGVEREPLGGAEFRQQRGKFFVSVNQATIFNRKSAKAQIFLENLCQPYLAFVKFSA